VTALPSSCSRCAFKELCGGLDDAQGQLFGCFINTQHANCDFTCPCRPAEFRARLREVGGLSPRAWKNLKLPTIALPDYVPLLRHGYRRTEPFGAEAPVGISIKDLFRRRRLNQYQPIVGTEAELRSAFGIALETPVVLVCVAQDQYIERYWAMRNVKGHDLAQRIAGLGFAAVTVPNYSAFTDAPRTDFLFNRKRMMIVAEELSSAGQAVIPHLNALKSADWHFWENLLSHQSIVYVAKEFQTGLRARSLGLEAIDELRRVQDRLGRALHPVAVGGAQYNVDLAARFATHTVIDSHPFLSSVHRRSFELRGGRMRRRRSEQELGPLLAENVELYGRHVADEARSTRCLGAFVGGHGAEK
jgi:Domain of unknown function (DUF4417)